MHQCFAGIGAARWSGKGWLVGGGRFAVIVCAGAALASHSGAFEGLHVGRCVVEIAERYAEGKVRVTYFS